MIERVSALIVRDKRILLVTGYDELFYWTPGGKCHEGEPGEDCLTRETEEELGVKVTGWAEFLKHNQPYHLKVKFSETPDEIASVTHYLVEFKGEIKPSKEITKTLWYSRQDFEKGEPKLDEGTGKCLIPKLIEEGII